MTRINVGIPVQNLTDEHLLAEHREIKRVCQRFLKRYIDNNYNGIPIKFTLNKGHELFCSFIPLYTSNRYLSIYNECINRGFNVTNYIKNWDVYKNTIYNDKDYEPKIEDINLLIQRISERINKSKLKSFHYYSKPITKIDALTILNS